MRSVTNHDGDKQSPLIIIKTNSLQSQSATNHHGDRLKACAKQLRWRKPFLLRVLPGFVISIRQLYLTRLSHINRTRPKDNSRGVWCKSIKFCSEKDQTTEVRHSRSKNNYFAELWSGSKEGSYLRLIDFVCHSNLSLRVTKKRRRRLGETCSGCIAFVVFVAGGLWGPRMNAREWERESEREWAWK